MNTFDYVNEVFGEEAYAFQIEVAVDSELFGEERWGVPEILAVEELFDVDMKGVGV